MPFHGRSVMEAMRQRYERAQRAKANEEPQSDTNNELEGRTSCFQAISLHVSDAQPNVPGFHETPESYKKIFGDPAANDKPAKVQIENAAASIASVRNPETLANFNNEYDLDCDAEMEDVNGKGVVRNALEANAEKTSDPIVTNENNANGKKHKVSERQESDS